MIDFFVTIKERAAAWKSQGGNPDEISKLRQKFAMCQRIPPGVEHAHIAVLDLSECALETIDLTSFVSLHVLMLQGNKFKQVGHKKQTCIEAHLSSFVILRQSRMYQNSCDRAATKKCT